MITIYFDKIGNGDSKFIYLSFDCTFFFNDDSEFSIFSFFRFGIFSSIDEGYVGIDYSIFDIFIRIF